MHMEIDPILNENEIARAGMPKPTTTPLIRIACQAIEPKQEHKTK